MTSANQNQKTIPPDHQIIVRPRRKRRWILWLLLLLAIFAVVVFLILHRGQAAAPLAMPPVTITVATAKTGNLGVYLDTIGTITPVYTDSITSQVNGEVTKVYFTEGQIVKAGAPLIDIDDRPYRANLLAAQGLLKRDENLLAESQMDLQRYQEAWKHNAIPLQTLQDQEKLVLQNEGTVENDQGTVQYDQVQVDFCHITSPIAGRVGLRLVDPGNVVTSSGGVTLAVITQVSPITVVFPIAQQEIGQVESYSNKGAKLPVDALGPSADKILDAGYLLTLDNQIDTTTGTVKARAQLPNSKAQLFPNQFVNVRLLVTTLKNVVVVPAAAIQQNGQASFVYVIQMTGKNTGVADMTSVTAGVSDNGFTQVKGIQTGQVVADSGFEKLQDKSKVVISTQPTTAESAGSNSP
ncbi:MAG TPA: efflux RND transporter periplasmic adaptor subunit [Tepidisphaeraceae bacterium]|nr:efflux RND transporter periplasmic adaptor subunit [Tepidisphaeraceae bacterium]